MLWQQPELVSTEAINRAALVPRPCKCALSSTSVAKTNILGETPRNGNNPWAKHCHARRIGASGTSSLAASVCSQKTRLAHPKAMCAQVRGIRNMFVHPKTIVSFTQTPSTTVFTTVMRAGSGHQEHQARPPRRALRLLQPNHRRDSQVLARQVPHALPPALRAPRLLLCHLFPPHRARSPLSLIHI